MTIREFIGDKGFDVNANIKVYAGGCWNENGKLVASFNGMPQNEDILDHNITYMTTDTSDSSIVIECDMPVESLAISRMLTVSTSHITDYAYEQLTSEDCPLAIYKKGDYGLFIYLPEELDEFFQTMPASVTAVMAFAKTNGCNMICFDSDGPVMSKLPVYEWKD